LSSKRAAPAEAKVIVDFSRTPMRRRWSSARYMIFCGAPAHLMGVEGNVKTRMPPGKRSRARHVASVVS